jgi:cytochrome c5
MKTRFLLLLVAPVLSLAPVFSQTPATAKPAAAPAPATTKKTNSTSQADDGGRKFDANCSRCHNAPEQLSPSLTGTVVRHMRVRANLSAQDEKDILRFLAP